MARLQYLLLFSILLFAGTVYPQSAIDKKLLYWDSIEPYRSFSKKKQELALIIKEANAGNDKKGLADCYRRYGIIQKETGKLDSAIYYCIRSAETAVSAGYALSEASSLNEVGIIYSELQNNRQALQYFEKAFDAYKNVPYYRGMSDLSYNMAEISLELGETDTAEAYCYESIRNLREWGDTASVGYNYELLSRIDLKNGNAKKALQHSRKAAWLFRESKDTSGWVPGLIQLGKSHRAAMETDSALQYSKAAYLLAGHYGNKKWMAEASRYLSELFEEKKMYDSALYYHHVYSINKDSLLTASVANASADALVRYETEKKELELINQKKLAESSRALNIALVVLTLLLLVAIAAITRNFRQRKKIAQKENDLENANAMIRGQDMERERIARELHDRVGSMLSTVKLYFSSMEEHIGKWIKQEERTYEKGIELLDETVEEVRRISHDLDSNLLNTVGFRTALSELIRILEATNKFSILFPDNQVPEEVYRPFATDLYRITQELLNNTIKYADAKEISIQLSADADKLVYSYEDDGKGFDKEQLKASAGIGFKNIDNRVNRMQGSWYLETQPGYGMNLIIEIPLYATNTNRNS